MQLIEYVRNHNGMDEFEARGIILAGKVYVNQEICAYCKQDISAGDTVTIKHSEKKYVTRAGQKLEKALHAFDVDVSHKVCIDIGAAEGGFTDCLLKNNAGRVYSVDVAYGIFDWNLRNNERVVVLERTNARYLDGDKVPEKCDLITSDVSFISIRKILPNVKKLLKPTGNIISLYKPQFELPRKHIGKNGNIENPEHVCDAVSETVSHLRREGIHIRKMTDSPIRGSNGNIEFLLYGDLNDEEGAVIEVSEIHHVVRDAYNNLFARTNNHQS